MKSYIKHFLYHYTHIKVIFSVIVENVISIERRYHGYNNEMIL